MRMAVIGKDVSASLSPKMHGFILSRLGVRCQYDAVSIPPEAFEREIEGILARHAFLNVTIPYKLAILPHLKRVLGDAATFGAVNTVKSAEREGYNTDGAGFLLSLETNGVSLSGKRALVLGAGGAGRSVIKKLAEAGAEVFATERDPARLQAVYGEFGCFTPLSAVPEEPFALICNCTGIGMHASEGKSPVGRELLSLCDVAYDLIYTPRESEFLRIAAACGKRTINGEGMLFYQAYYADCIFLGKTADAAEAKSLFSAYREAL